MDSLETLADEQLYLLAEDVKLQLEQGAKAGNRPVVVLLAMQRKIAAAALIGLVNADAEDTKVIRGFQQQAQLYYDLISHVREMLSRGREADRDISERERVALNDAVDNMSEEERRALNIEPRGDDE